MKSIRSILHILLGVTLICSCNEATELAHITPNVSLIKYKDIVKIDSLYTYPGDSLYQNWINQYNKNLEDKTSRSLSPEDDAFFNKQYIVKSTEATVLYGMYLANLHTSFLCNLIYPTFSRILLYSC